MKTIVNMVDENNNNNNNTENQSLIDIFDNEPGYYRQVVRTMLSPGHETELIYWFRNIGLIPNTQICPNANHDVNCNKLMEWLPAKIVDFYQWRCRNCLEKKSIRDNSIFNNVKCNFKNSIRILLGWCKSYNIETMANILGVRKHTVRTLYTTCTTIVQKSLKSQQIGGPGVIVLVDTYPEGCTNHRRPVRGNRPILCIAEAKNIPPRYWFEALDRTNLGQIQSIKQQILKLIQDLVLPGSILVTRLDSTLCSYNDVQSLNHHYPIIVNIENLSKHNTNTQIISNNLETIWKFALNICEEAQFYCFDEIPNFLVGQMWLLHYKNESFEMLLNQLTDLR